MASRASGMGGRGDDRDRLRRRDIIARRKIRLLGIAEERAQDIGRRNYIKSSGHWQELDKDVCLYSFEERNHKL
jgi:hypothetical protein